VIGPYPTEDFFRQFLEAYSPKEILLVVDEGCNRDVLGRIEEVCTASKLRVRCASCRNCGLLHAKVYLAEWGTQNVTCKRLLWGSLNASQNGFHVNGEVVSAVTLNAEEERAIVPYFRHLWESPSGSVASLDLTLLGRVRLLLPAFRFFPPSPEPETFDAWVQAGHLCYKFQRDQTFAKLSVKLLKPLPKNMIERLFEKEGLRADTETDTVRFPYVQDVVKDEGPVGPRWRAKYFLETWLGFWTSDSCYRARRNEFTAHNEQQRKEVLTIIKQSDQQDRREWCDEFIERLRRVLAGIKEAGHKPQSYFWTRQNDIDLQHYRRNALEELRSHRKRAHNSIFEKRFTTGYEFPPLPRFRVPKPWKADRSRILWRACVRAS
jgi:hypothetical protein